MEELNRKNLDHTYFELLNRQQFIPESLDYNILEQHKPMLQSLASLGNSGISVFDFFKKEHAFYSSNFSYLLGYHHEHLADGQQKLLDSKIHPEDYLELSKNGIMLIKLFYEFSSDEKHNYKLINEYRILNAADEYVRVVEQHQILELDVNGNLWLAFSIIDFSPDQNLEADFKSQLLNFRTGKIIPVQKETANEQEEIDATLTNRERQILKMVRDGLLSKEISGQLDISVHTVNTHRQRILQKLGVNNSMEAVVYASKLGLV
ncbi:LuxR C-terminal-related transcriptional regulator [Pedobacter gandavensis]|uniref:LuxR C-terminal-related transcriptional regulator n=1 Tax=Pedobacter gandavensis TaxID=2679963 RepID=UPI00292E484F|nr:LuxR C-terminal-related transcriptional regulator [Pedobacter gandavensis]